MGETNDWRARYQQLVREFDEAELRWRDLEHILRRIIGRLCAAAAGADSRLDEGLEALAAASRAGGRDGHSSDDWTGLFNRLDAAVTGLRRGVPPATEHRGSPPAPQAALQPVPGPQPVTPSPPAVAVVDPPVREPGIWRATIRAIDYLLRQLAEEFAGEIGPEEAISKLLGELPAITSDAGLAVTVERAAQLVAGRAERLARERLEAAGLLERVTQRLEEISAYMSSAQNDRSAVARDADQLNAAVTTQVQQLSAEVQDSNDLGALKRSVGSHLEAITAQVGEFQVREQRRYSEYEQRAALMSARLTQLESQARELHRTLDDERRRARLDPLTGTANRAAFDERFAQEVARNARSGAPVSVLLWDLDHFKTINDRFGHRIGDGVLREVARCLARELRVEDFIARIGGEEFATLLIGCSLDNALKRAEQLRAAVAALKLHVHGTPLRVTVSCGATEIRAEDTTDTLFDRADAALYRAKQGGRNLCTAA